MEFLLLIALGIVFFRLRATHKTLERRLETYEIGQVNVQAEISALRRHVGLASGPLPVAEGEPAPDSQVNAAPPDAAATPATPPGPAPPPSSVPPHTVPAAAPAQPAPVISLEERLGTRWAVWVGGLALALGGLLLVRYSIEQGLIGPELRITLGALLAVLMAGAAEYLRRHERSLGLPRTTAAHIPSILTSAATVVAFGTAYAAHALYQLIGPGPAFVLLGAIGIAAMLAAAVHGPAVAGVGLVGAFAAPALVTTSSPSPWPLVLYLAVIAATAYALARLRSWLWLAATVVAGVCGWGVLMLHPPAGHFISAWTPAAMTHALLQLALAAGVMAIEPYLGRDDATALPDWISTAALAALTVLILAVLAAAVPDNTGFATFGLIAIGILAVTALVSAPAAGAALLAGVVMLGTLLVWPGLREGAGLQPPFMREAGEVLRLPAHVSSFLVFAALVPLGLGLETTWRLQRGARLPMPTAALLATGATLPALLALVIAYLRVTQFDHSIRFALAGAVLAALFAVATELFANAERAEATPARRIATGTFAAAASAALALALTAGLDRGYLTVAFTLAALGTAWVATRRDIPLLRHAVIALGAIVLARVAYDPRIMGTAVGQTPIFNWLLFGYGVPAFAFALSARLLRSRADDLAVRLADGLAVLFAALLVTFEIRHFVHSGDPLHAGSNLVEVGMQATTSLGFAYVLSRLDLARANPVFRIASLAAGVVATVLTVIGLGLAENPLLTNDPITGATGFNALLIAYLLPGLLAVVVARSARGVRPDWYVAMIAILAVLLIFAYVSLEVRHAFQGQRLGVGREISGPEQWAYSVAWLALGLLFLGYGIVRRAGAARVASAALVLLSVLKVFLLDLQGLTGLWRALSFISLGVILIAIGLVYQRVLFPPPSQAPTPPQDA